MFDKNVLVIDEVMFKGCRGVGGMFVVCFGVENCLIKNKCDKKVGSGVSKRNEFAFKFESNDFFI